MAISTKIMSPLDELVGYMHNTPLKIVASLDSASILNRQIESLGGVLKSPLSGNILTAELPLDTINAFAYSTNVRCVIFDGKAGILSGKYEQEGKFDKYLVELLILLRSTRIIVQTEDGYLKEEDISKVQELGGEVKKRLEIVDSYSANLPLCKIADLSNFSRVRRIYYDTKL